MFGPSTFSSASSPAASQRDSKIVRTLSARPVGSEVRRVVEHLADDLSPETRVARAFDLHECRDGVLVDEQVIEAPATATVIAVRDRDLLRDQQPPTR